MTNVRRSDAFWTTMFGTMSGIVIMGILLFSVMYFISSPMHKKTVYVTPFIAEEVTLNNGLKCILFKDKTGVIFSSCNWELFNRDTNFGEYPYSVEGNTDEDNDKQGIDNTN